MFGLIVMFSGCENIRMKILLIFLCASYSRIEGNYLHYNNP
jgi:hypothetical protein